MYDTQYWYRPGNNSSVYNFNGYNGGSYWGAPSYPADSRRNLGGQNVVNPVNPFSQYGQVQNNNSVPENLVQPFSSYPPATPTGTPVAGAGLNAFVESRRNATPVAGTAPQNNPWAQQSTPAQAAPQVNALNFQPSCANCSLFNNNGGTNPWNYTISTFDKKGVWNNEYTQPRPLDMPYDAWKNVNKPAAPVGGYEQFNYSTLGLNTFTNHQPVSENWNDIATKNWSPETL